MALYLAAMDRESPLLSREGLKKRVAEGYVLGAYVERCLWVSPGKLQGGLTHLVHLVYTYHLSPWDRARRGCQIP